MTEIKWVSYKGKLGCKHVGNHKFILPANPDKWDRIIGVVSKCEGNHDTFVSYDGTGATWGIGQWTFTSGRLQALLEYMRTFKVPILNSSGDSYNVSNAFEALFGKKGEKFRQFGFTIEDGQFIDLDNQKAVVPETYFQKAIINDICMGTITHFGYDSPKEFAMALAKVFVDAGSTEIAAYCQTEFAKMEFSQSLKYHRSALNYIENIDNLLKGTWETWIPALFFNLWQNSPSAAYKLFIPSCTFAKEDPNLYKEHIWRSLNNSMYGNWSFAKEGNTSPRILRIAEGIKEFYGEDLRIIGKPS